MAGTWLLRRYRQHSRTARERLNSVDRRVLRTTFGNLEYAESGEGTPLLVVHGIFGGRDAGLLSFGSLVRGRRVIAPSRFGYLGSDMPTGATPATQSDAFVELLDHLAIDHIDVVGYSAGSTSSLQLALRHPERVRRLAIMCGDLPGPTAVRAPAIMKVVYRSDFIMWLARTFARPALMSLVGGVPKTYPFTQEESTRVTRMMDSIFPVRDRAQGVLFDAFVSNPDVNSYPLEAVGVPTLIVHSRDDAMASYEAARNAADRIPGARLVSLERGGHLMLGQEDVIRRHVSEFLATPNAAPVAARNAVPA